MIYISIRGGDGETAANEISSAVAGIFGREPARVRETREDQQVYRSLTEAILIVLALPPAVIGAVDMASRSQLREKLSALIAKIDGVRKVTKSSVLVDPGDGKYIPLEEARIETILAALAAIEQKLKQQVEGNTGGRAPQTPSGTPDLPL